ncbi:MAG: TetR/AcrR family transcriptional regulator [Pseudomonadota bacterium]
MSVSRREQNRQAKAGRILDAALQVFADQGYDGASMDAIAREAGVSKPTLYQYFGNKQALFTAMLETEREGMLAPLSQVEGRDTVAVLHAFAWRYAKAVLRPDMLSLARLIIGEAARQPGIGALFQSVGPDTVRAGLVDYLQAQRDVGALVFDDAELAAEDLWGLILSAPRTQALYRPEVRLSERALARYIHNGLRVFLTAYAREPEHALTTLKGLIAAGPVRRRPAS